MATSNLSYLMRLPRFDHLEPETIDEACSLLSKYKGKAKVIAGGTDLLISMKKRQISPQYVVNIKSIPDLDYIRYNQESGLKIGALATHQSIASSPIIKDKFGLLAIACNKIGTPQVRNMGTVGGNICMAAPSADTAPPLIALGARVKLVSSRGERIVALEEFLTGPGDTVLEADETLTEIQVPSLAPHAGGVYLRLSQRSTVDIAAVGVAASITLGEDEICSDAKIVLGAVAPTPIRAKRAEDAIKGKKIEDDLLEETARLASEEARPISDVRSSANYRKEMVRVLTKRAIMQALEQAKSA